MDTTCTPGAVYGAISFCPGTVVLPGIRRRVYFIRKDDIATWPENPILKALKDGTAINASTAAVITENFVLASGKKWIPLDIEITRSNVESETQGELHSRTYLNRATLHHNTVGKAVSGFAAVAVNDDLVFLIQQADGRFRLIGSELFDTQVNPAAAIGQGPTSESGSTITVEGTDLAPAPFYEGEIVLDADTKISGIDGSPISGS